MRLIDADALLKDVRQEVLLIYDKAKDECAEHLDLDDDQIIYLHELEKYTKIKFAYHWLKNQVNNAPTVEQIKEQKDE